MIILSNKIKVSASYLVLTCYLIITITNAIHHHKSELGKSYSFLSLADNNQNYHNFLNGSVDFCPVQTAYNSLQNSIISFSNSFQNPEKMIDVISLNPVSTKPLKSYILHLSLRAPPKIS